MRDGVLTLRSRAAWAHDSNTDHAINPTFQSIAGTFEGEFSRTTESYAGKGRQIRVVMSAFGGFCCRSDLKALANSDSVVWRRSAVEIGDDGTAEARTGAIFLFIPP
jgi:hypothetical protein